MHDRLERAAARHDQRAWVQDRRRRTRRLILLGGLVEKSGLAAATEGDAALLLGALSDLHDRLASDTSGRLRAAYQARGRAEF